jgi:phosphonate transport system permease protein
MKQVKNTFKFAKAIALDFVFYLYVLGCIYFLVNKITEFSFSYWILVVAALILAVVFYAIGDSLGRKKYFPSDKTDQKFTNTIWGWSVIISLILTVIVGWVLVDIKPIKFITKFKNAKNIVSGIVNPNFDNFNLALRRLAETIYLALFATLFAIPFAFVFSFLAARNLMPRNILGNTIYYIVRTLATFFRSIEALVWAIIFSVWVGLGPFAGMLALMIHSIAALTKLYSEQIENIDPGPVEAIKATGASGLQVWIFAVIPQIVAPFLAFTIYRWDINVRMATIVGFVGGGGIGYLLQQQQQLLRWRSVGLIILLIALTVWVMDIVSGKVREKLLDL